MSSPFTFRATVLPWDPVSIKVAEDPSSSSKWTGMLVEVLEGLKAALNFTLVYTSPQDGVWGAKVPTVYANF